MYHFCYKWIKRQNEYKLSQYFHFLKCVLKHQEHLDALWRTLTWQTRMREPGQLCHGQGSAQNENVEPLIQKAGKKLFLSSPSFFPVLTQGFPLWLPAAMRWTGELLRPGQTLIGARGPILGLRWDSYQTLTLPANVRGPHREWRVAVVMGRLKRGGWAGPGTRGQGWVAENLSWEGLRGQRGACVRAEAPSPWRMLRCPMRLPL